MIELTRAQEAVIVRFSEMVGVRAYDPEAGPGAEVVLDVYPEGAELGEDGRASLRPERSYLVGPGGTVVELTEEEEEL